MAMKFIHAADLHIDSPMRGLDAHDGAPVDRLRNATREAFENLVTLAIDERVDFVILAGDLFDGKWPDMKTGIWTSRQFWRLQGAGIPVFLLRGNHDARSQVQQTIRWPDCVREFSVERPESLPLDELNVVLHGQGFPTRDIPEDLAASYPAAVSGAFNIGVLHTSLTGDPEHDTYAPTNVETLVGRGYDYWALGHIHARQTVCEEPYIAWSGNTQGRHVRETGAKGCLLVTVDGQEVVDVEFRATDVLRWHNLEVRLRESDSVDAMHARLQDSLAECHRSGEGRFSAVRILVRGACAAHQNLVAESDRDQAICEIRNLAHAFHGELWIEKVMLETSPPVDPQSAAGIGGLMGELKDLIHLTAVDENELFKLASDLTTLADKATGDLEQANIDLFDREQLRQWLQRAEGLLESSVWEPAAKQ